MSNASLNNKADPKELDNAKELWAAFTGLLKWSVITIVLLLAAMAAFLV